MTTDFYIDESGELLNIDDLKAEYNRLKDAGETEAETFIDYMENATSPDGTLEPAYKCETCGDYFPLSDLKRESDLGLICDFCERGFISRGEKLNIEE